MMRQAPEIEPAGMPHQRAGAERVIAKCIYPMVNPETRQEEMMVIEIAYDSLAGRMTIDSRSVDMNGRLRFMGQPRVEPIADPCHFFDAMGIQNRRGLLRDIYFE